MEIVESIMLFSILVCPVFVLILSYFKALPVSGLFKLSIISFIVIYGLYVGASELLDIRLRSELDSFDLNGDGSFSGNEITPDSEAAMKRMGSDTGRTFAPLVGVFISLIYNLFFFGAFIFVRFIYNKVVDHVST